MDNNERDPYPKDREPLQERKEERNHKCSSTIIRFKMNSVQNDKTWKCHLIIMCHLIFFNTYVDDLTRKWKQLVNLLFKISRDSYLNVLLFVYELCIIQKTEFDLQKSVFVLNQIGSVHLIAFCQLDRYCRGFLPLYLVLCQYLHFHLTLLLHNIVHHLTVFSSFSALSIYHYVHRINK